MTERIGSPPMSWAEYRERVVREWAELLAHSPAESEVQTFLELHPALVPYPQGFAGAGGSDGAHGSIHFGLFTQPPLPGIERPVPDFMRMTRNSGGIYPILIEIEAPTKRIANRNGDPTAAFTHAVAQIADWRLWFSDPANQLQFRDLYRIPSRWLHRPLQPRYVLVYGRRPELETRRVQALRHGSAQADFEIMSFDRLQPSESGSMDVTVRLSGRAIKAVAFSPTFQVGPEVGEALAMIQDKDAALKQSAMMSSSRRRFLGERIPYWENQGKMSGRIYQPVWE